MAEALAGPAVIVEAQTSTIVPPGFDVSADPYGSLILTRTQEDRS